MKKILINSINVKMSGSPSVKAKVLELLKKEKVDGILSLTFCNDKFIRELNRSYRKKDCATDVLSFTMGEDNLLGDVFISIETAVRQAKEYGVCLQEELERLAVHGTLHILGYTHKEMKKHER